MAPEQIQGDESDARSDIFSFGVVLFEMLTGKLPFRGEHDAAIMYSIVNEEPQQITQLLPDLSPIVVNLISRCLEKDPGERYQHFDDITADLKRAMRRTSKVMRSSSYVPVQRQEDAVAAPALSGTEHRQPGFFSRTSTRIGIGGFILVIIALIVWLMTGSSRPGINPAMSPSILQIPAVEYQYPDMSSDGKWLAFPGSDVDAKWDIYLMFIETGESRRLTSDYSVSLGNAASARFSPDGSSIAYTRRRSAANNSEVCIVSVLSGSSRVVADTGLVPSWNSAGDRIFYYRMGRDNPVQSRSGWREYWSVSPQGADPKVEFVDSLMAGILGYFSFKVSPVGNKVAFTRPMVGEFNEIFIHDLSSGKEIQLTHDKKTIDEVTWTDNGYIFYSSNRSGNFNIWAIPETGGESVQVTSGAGPDNGISVSTAANRIIYSQQSHSYTLWEVNTDGTAPRQLFPDENIEEGDVSPDGTTFALRIHQSTSRHNIMIRDLAGTRQEILFPSDQSVERGTPLWSPSGQLLAYNEISYSEGVTRHAKIIDIGGGRRIQDMGEGRIQGWISDSLILVTRNTSMDKNHPEYNESHVVNTRTGVDTLFFRKSTFAGPDAGNTVITYTDLKSGWYMVSRKELSKNPSAKGSLIFQSNEVAWGDGSPTTAYYVSGDRKVLWKMDWRSLKKSKIIDLPPGDNRNFNYDRFRNAITFGRFKGKTSIVKVDNVFLK
jgi:Tol biopolymer transport system component